MGSSRMPERDLLALNIARAEVGVREATGLNDGKRVEEYLAAVGLPKGHPYCAAFVSWAFKKAGYDQPRTAWSPVLFPNERVVGYSSGDPSSLRFARHDGQGLVFGIYFPALKRIAHCGFVSQVKGDWIGTIEANTSLPGNREGDGVYTRTRHFRTIRCYADWTRKGGVKNR
ncbi:peptidoglycan-binding protein [Pedobacter heparinus]|uniref:peptidoglycan-binding protein n=1 Tax=Pedobacter heparinus TaxID=984 RepID=UPI00293199D5|nr:peptidoglycan-binding protein [Pedobacter heparinus]